MANGHTDGTPKWKSTKSSVTPPGSPCTRHKQFQRNPPTNPSLFSVQLSGFRGVVEQPVSPAAASTAASGLRGHCSGLHPPPLPPWGAYTYDVHPERGAGGVKKSPIFADFQ